MSHRKNKLKQERARQERNNWLLLGALMLLLGLGGLFKAVADLRSGDLTSGINAASQQPYGTFLRLVGYSFMAGAGFWVIYARWKPKTPTKGKSDDTPSS